MSADRIDSTPTAFIFFLRDDRYPASLSISHFFSAQSGKKSDGYETTRFSENRLSRYSELHIYWNAVNIQKA